MLRRLLVALLVVVVIVVGAGAVYVASRQNLRFDAPYPPVHASPDSAVVARGRYIVRSVAGCTGCHGDPAAIEAYRRGDDVPLSGGTAWSIPPGTFYAKNITPDPETGIGSFPDSAVARALRYGVGHDGRALLPFMTMQGLSDEDLTAVVSYLRTMPAARHPVPSHRFTLLGTVVKATVLANPVGPAAPPPAVSPRGPSLENGRYLVERVADCGGCHTQRDLRTGTLVGAPFAGATGMIEQSDPGRSWSPPNITTGGRLGGMNEEAFIRRFRAGRAIPGSPMPWQGYQRMEEDDLRAIYRYLATVPPSSNDVGPPVVEVAKK